MAQYARDWTEYDLGDSIGDGVDDITPHLAATGYTTQIIETEISPSGRGLYVNRGGFTDVALWTVDQLGSAVESGEVFISFYTTHASVDKGLSIMGAGYVRPDLNPEQSYLGGGAEFGGALNYAPSIYRTSGESSASRIASGDFIDATGNGERLRNSLFQFEQGSGVVHLRAKSWWADSEEPEEWDVETTDATYSGDAGRIGFGRVANSNNQSILVFLGIGTNGDPAPTGPGGGPEPDVITIGAGGFGFVGMPVGTHLRRTERVGAATWGWVGQPFTTRVAGAVRIAAAVWTWAGQHVAARASRVQAIGAAAWGWTGRPLAARVSRTLRVPAAAWRWTGQALRARASRVHRIAAAPFAWVGQALRVRGREVLVIGAAAWHFTGQAFRIPRRLIGRAAHFIHRWYLYRS